MRPVFVVLPWLALLLAAADAPPPVAVPAHHAIDGLSSGQFESHPAFDPVNGDFYFVRSTLQRNVQPGAAGDAKCRAWPRAGRTFRPALC